MGTIIRQQNWHIPTAFDDINQEVVVVEDGDLSDEQFALAMVPAADHIPDWLELMAEAHRYNTESAMDFFHSIGM
jgi:hypothetical protein